MCNQIRSHNHRRYKYSLCYGFVDDCSECCSDLKGVILYKEVLYRKYPPPAKYRHYFLIKYLLRKGVFNVCRRAPSLQRQNIIEPAFSHCGFPSYIIYIYIYIIKTILNPLIV